MNSIDITKLYLDYNYICTLVHVYFIIYIEDMNSKDITTLYLYYNYICTFVHLCSIIYIEDIYMCVLNNELEKDVKIYHYVSMDISCNESDYKQ